jgi:hypothetical protein
MLGTFEKQNSHAACSKGGHTPLGRGGFSPLLFPNIGQAQPTCSGLLFTPMKTTIQFPRAMGKTTQLLLLLALLPILTGCSGLMGLGYSAETERDYQAGEITKKVTKRDLSLFTSRAVLTSKEASAVTHSRSNLTGTASSTSIGKIASDPDEKAIDSMGTAVGKALKEVMGVPSVPAPAKPSIPEKR